MPRKKPTAPATNKMAKVCDMARQLAGLMEDFKPNRNHRICAKEFDTRPVWCDDVVFKCLGHTADEWVWNRFRSFLGALAEKPVEDRDAAFLLLEGFCEADAHDKSLTAWLDRLPSRLEYLTTAIKDNDCDSGRTVLERAQYTELLEIAHQLVDDLILFADEEIAIAA